MSPHRNSTAVRVGLAAAAVSATVLFAFLSPTARAQDPSSAVPMRSESWFRPLLGVHLDPTEACDLPTGCLPAVPPEVSSPPSPYPEGTLHVGVSGGQEDARAYVTVDLSSFLADFSVEGGTLSMPLAMEPEAATVAPETAKLRVCAVDAFVSDGADGDIIGAPAVDCAKASSPATYIEGDAPRFEVDVAPFVERWSKGFGSLALVPADPAPGDTWHLAFSRRDREAEGAQSIQALLQLAERPEPPTATTTSVVPPTTAGVTFDPPPTNTDIPPPPPPALDTTAPTQPDAPQELASSPVMSPGDLMIIDSRFRYPAIFLLPLVFGIAAVWAARAFTVDLHVQRT